MKKFLLTLTLHFLALIQSSSAEVTSYGSFRHYAEMPEVLFLVGEVIDGDSFELRRAMRNYDVKLIITASPGGSLYEGLQIAAILNDNYVGTYVPEGASCESSCANIFLGGSQRMLAGGLGVHQFYADTDSGSSEDVTRSATQYTSAEIIGILNEFGTPAFVYEKMFGTNDIYYFQGAERILINKNIEQSDFLKLIGECDQFIHTNPDAILRISGASESDTTLEESPLVKAPTATLEEGALGFLSAFNADWSQENYSALPRISGYYAPNVIFYGKSLTHSEVMAEKEKFALRWPDREYYVEPGSVSINCYEDACLLESVILWSASSPERDAHASGRSTWILNVRFIDGKLKISSEDGETLSRD